MHEASRWKKWLAGPIIVACATCAAVETSEQMQALDGYGSGSGSGSSYPDAGTTGGTDGGSGSSGPTCTINPEATGSGSGWEVQGIELGIGTETPTFQTAAAVFCRALRMAGWPSTTDGISLQFEGEQSDTWSTSTSCESKHDSKFAGKFGVELCGPFIEGGGAKSSTQTTQLCKDCNYPPRYQCTTESGSGCFTSTDKASLEATVGQNFDLGKSFFDKYSSSAVKLSGGGSISGTVSGSKTSTKTGGTDACTGATCQHTHSEDVSGSLGFDLSGSMSGYVYGFGASAKASGGGTFTWTVGWNGPLAQWCLLTDVTAKFGITVTGKVSIDGATTSTTIFKWECKTSLKGDSCVSANNTLEDLVCETTWLVPEDELDCQPLTCATLGYKCGSFDSCGQTIQCGSCNPGYTCEPEWGNSLGTYCREPDDPPPPPPCDEDCHRFCSLECYGDGAACYDGCMADCTAEACGSGSGSGGY